MVLQLVRLFSLNNLVSRYFPLPSPLSQEEGSVGGSEETVGMR